MKKISMVVEKYYGGNRMFDLANMKVNRDDCMYPFFALKRRLAEMGYDLSTDDINRPEDSDIVLYNDMPARLPEVADARKSILLAWESPLIKPRNFDDSLHGRFARIYTYDDRFIDGKKYFKLFYAQRFPEAFEFMSRPVPRKLICVISGNKTSDHPQELYSERLKTIKWFEANHPGELDLYGFGWNEHVFKGAKIVRAMNRIPLFRKAFVRDKRPSYRGAVGNKRDVYARYRFALCYENIRDVPGYITEKLIDALLSGCVPVYWGASNVTDYVPRDCLIDRREFEDEANLYRFIIGLDDAAIREYQERIQAFLVSDAANPFKGESFAEALAEMVSGVADRQRTVPAGGSDGILLTIAIPTFNREKYLEELLTDMIPQIDKANERGYGVELLISDNCSTDGTAILLDRKLSGKKWVSRYRNERNVGGDANFVLCAKRSTGKYVWIFGDDEVLRADGIERVCRALRLYGPGLLICGSNSLRTRFFASYRSALDHFLPWKIVFPWNHTLITSNVFRREGFCADAAERMIHTNYGHMYAMVDLLADAANGVMVFSKNRAAFFVRKDRAPFEKEPRRIEKKLLAYLGSLSAKMQYPRLAFWANAFFRIINRIRGMILPLARRMKRSVRIMQGRKR